MWASFMSRQLWKREKLLKGEGESSKNEMKVVVHKVKVVDTVRLRGHWIIHKKN